jgi:hypothetical protein
MRALSDSTLTWTYPTLVQTQTTTGFVPYPPAGYDCSFRFSKGSARPPGDDGADYFDPGSITVSCSGGPYGLYDLVISALGDVRDWPAGTFTRVAPPGTVAVKGFFGSTCGGNLDGLALTVTVETATGGPAPFPQLVTSDFVRTFRLELDTSTVTPPNGPNGDACDFPLSGQVSLHLTQTTADYVADPGRQCYCL